MADLQKKAFKITQILKADISMNHLELGEKKLLTFVSYNRNIWAKFDQNLRAWVTWLSLNDMESPNSYFKNKTDDNEYLFNIYDKTNKTTTQTPDDLCNEVEETTNVTQTCSRRIVKIPSRYDDCTMK